MCRSLKVERSLLDILHTNITITIRDYEIQLIIITITWYRFFLNTTATLLDQLLFSADKYSVWLFFNCCVLLF